MGAGSRITGSPQARDVSQQKIVIAVLQRTAIHDLRVPENTMTSPYLNQARSTRKIIEELIVARELELAKTTAVQRRRVERDLTFLRDELARIDSPRIRPLAGCGRTRTAPR